MTEKEIDELKAEVTQLKNSNAVLSAAFLRMIQEYNSLMKSIHEHSERMKQVVEALKSSK